MSDDDDDTFYFDMREEMFFPVFPDLPGDDDIDLRYYDDPGSYGVTGPIKHWCLLVEIVQKIPYPRPTFKVKDKDNNELLVGFYFDNDVKMPAIWEKRCKEGGVMAIMYAVAHDFLDGQHGVRVEEVENVKFLPCSLSTLFRIGDDLDLKPVSKICARCKKPGGLQCSRCSVTKYCGKECQVADWKARHKNECIAIQQVLDWKKRDWADFEEYWQD
ncbi:hypothetical protein BDN70DRAFT_851332 [Pholiota conissans]|uniref:MYND-type domain-containing protein n=1 Tax=Pholiota conissans TaxID=109636 RepID=A0A9P5ZD24_9AGAR|nr:hypothetical protein BDN70DRAFT_851332 [Pholiota conissans]